MTKEYIEDLCIRYFINDHEKIRREYLRYKAEHIDTLSFVSDEMLMIYEYAFFFHVTKTNVSRRELTKKINPKIFRAALAEVKEKYIPTKDVEERKETFTCNLYSIVNPW